LASALEASVARRRGDMPALVEAASGALEILAEASPAHLPTAPEYRANALNQEGVGLFWMGRFGRAESRLRSAMVLAEASGVELTRLNALGHLALLEAEQGNLHDAYGHADDALQLGKRRGWPAVVHIVPAFLALALISLDRNALDDATAACADGYAAQRPDPEPVQHTALRIAEARILLARGEIDRARLTAERTGWPSDTGPLPPLLARWLAEVKAEIELSAGHPEETLRSIALFSETAKASARMLTSVARARLALGDPRAAEAVLTPLQTSVPDVRSAVEVWLITALVEDALRQNNKSVDALARAVALAEPQGMRGPFIGVRHPRVAGLLEQLLWLIPERSSFVADLLADFSSAPSTSPGAREPVELTDRELDVLRYLPTMLRNHEIAAQMYVSVNTVKAHLRALYRKLDVTGRREAVDRARDLGLL